MTTKNSPRAWPLGYGRLVVPEVGSTLDAAREAARTEPAPFWILAYLQTAARGRRGRSWSMPQGNFAATLVIAPDSAPSDMALRSFVMALALYDALDGLTGQRERLALKWPNDVLLNGGKVAGILLERSGDGPLLIGVGVNLVAAPSAEVLEQTALRPATLSEETGTNIEPEVFLDALASTYAEWETTFQSFGFAPVRDAWLARAARLGARITARMNQEELTGVFEDVDLEGHLVIRGPRGLRRLAAADIYF